MADKTGIEWTDATWNPVTGCTKVSPGCDHCYAETFAERFRGVPGHHFERGFDVVLRPERLDQPLRWRRPRRIFVNSMSDLFHDSVSDEYIARVFAVMALAPQHTFQVLTKRHGRMRSLLNSDTFHGSVAAAVRDQWGRGNWHRGEPPEWQDSYRDRLAGWPLPNVWLGVSVENQQWADIRIPALLDTPAAVRFLSCEPLLGPVSMFANTKIDTGTLVDWVIVGGESGRGARPMHPAWVRGLRNECQQYGIAFHFKQWGEYAPSQGRIRRQTFIWPDGAVQEESASTSPIFPGRFITDVVPTRPGWVNVERVGKKASGRDLDGRTWDEFPQAVSSHV